ncbi:MAG: ATP-dependent zinc metalloprotease FtsH [Opitutales bacterium]
MSENKPSNKPSQGGNGQPPERFQPKVILIWLVIFAAIIGVWSLNGVQQGQIRTMTIPEVIAAVENNEVDGGSMYQDSQGGMFYYVIEGTLIPSEQLSIDGDVVPPAPDALGTPFRAEGRVTDEQIGVLQGSFREERGGNYMMELVFGLLPFVIIIALLYFLFIRQLRNAGKGAMSFGKSKAKMLTRERDRITFKEVAGCDEAKEEVSEVVDFLKDPKKFQRIGGRIPKGVLMVGPPGTGKTLLARAVAGEAEVPFFSISGSDFVEMFVGVGAARVRDMFEQGRKNAPCIIFIDEIDAVGRQRGAGLGGGNDEREQTLNSLLVEMDGFDGHEGVIIIAATNRPDVLDNALLRPGRFDRQVVIDLPDLNGRHEILNVHSKKIALSKTVDLEVVARNTPGFSGADLANLLNEAALVAARGNKKEVTHQEIDEAREKIAFGRERRKLMDEEDRRIIAWHEAGHAIVSAAINDKVLPVHKVTIIPRGQSLGSVSYIPSKDILNQSKRRMVDQMCTAMGGRAAEEIVIGDITSGASADIRAATKIARSMVCDWGMSDLGPVAYGENQDHVFLGKEISRNQNYSEETARKIDKAIYDLVEGQHERAVAILTEHRKALDTLAESLLEFETLEGKHVMEILETGSIQSPITPVKKDDEEPEKSDTPPALHPKKKENKDDGNFGGEPAGVPA